MGKKGLGGWEKKSDIEAVFLNMRKRSYFWVHVMTHIVSFIVS